MPRRPNSGGRHKSTFTLALVTGLSVADISQYGVNLGWDEIRLPAPVFEGDTIYAQSEVLSTRESKWQLVFFFFFFFFCVLRRCVLLGRPRGGGGAAGEMTTVLRTLQPRQAARADARPPSDRGDRLAAGDGRRGGDRLHLPRQPRQSRQRPAKPARAEGDAASDQLCDTCAVDYNPDAPSGPGDQHPQLDGLAIDGNRDTPGSRPAQRERQAGVGATHRAQAPGCPGGRPAAR